MAVEPSTTKEWMDVARERGADAVAMLPNRSSSVGPVYMAGYAIECSIKAFLQENGIPRPTKGGQGHNLCGLWHVAKFRLADLRDPTGRRAFFFEEWTTDLRYQIHCPAKTADSAALVAAAKGLVGWIQSQIKRQRRPR